MPPGKTPRISELLKQGKKTSFPESVLPMLATLTDKPFDEPGWMFEVKWDGYRAIAMLNKGKVEIRSRNNKSFNDKFYPVHQALKKWKINAIVDGEIVVVNEKGIADFSDLQNWRSEADGELAYYIFDLLWLNGSNIMMLPLSDRRKLLSGIIPDIHGIRLSEAFETGAKKFFELAARLKLEGIIAKKSDSVYMPGIRTKEWLKIKTELRQEVVIGGFTQNENSSKLFSALLMGIYNGKELEFTGSVGTGFSDKLQKELLKKMKKYIAKKAPFAIVPDVNKPSRFRPVPPKATVTWLKPVLVAEISYREMTRDGIMRHPSFKGLREDKSAKEISLEKTVPAETVTDQKAPEKFFGIKKSNERKTLLNPKDEMQVRKVNGHDLKFTNLSKIFFPKDKVTKRDVINYYYQVAPYMLPYMKDRPQTLNRHPNGINGESFYQKDVTGKVPEWIRTFPYFSEADNRKKHFLVCNTEADLLYIASLGCIEMHPWSSRASKPDHPDWCIIDLDPDRNSFEQVIVAAQVTREILEDAGITSYCKTSGSTGLHIYIPLGAKYTYEESREFARIIAKLVHQQIPKFTSIERLTSKRNGKMYIDFLQNRPQATLAAPYSLRPKNGATISMPLHWDEVKKGLKMQHHTIFNAVARLKETGDLFAGVPGKGINMKTALKKLA